MILPNWYDVDIQNPISPVPLQQILATGDKAANRIGVRLFNGGEAYSPGGSCRGYVLRADGATVPILDGTISGNEMSIDLPEAAYAVQGSVVISIVNITSGSATTVFLGVGSVNRTQSDVVIDPGEVLDDINTLIEAIEAAVESIPADYSDLQAGVAPAFSTSTAYAAGDYVWYNGELYRFTTAHAAGSWTGTDAQKKAAVSEFGTLRAEMAAVQDSVDDLTRVIETTKQNSYTWSKATIDASDGTPATSNVRLRTGYLSPHFGAVSANDGYMFAIYVYDENSVYQGRYTGSGYVKSSGFSTEPLMCVGIPSNYQVRYVLSKTDSGSITTADGVNLLLHVYTDSGLTLSGKAADAAAVGTMFAKSMVYRGTIATTKDFDEVTEIGTYSFASSSATDTHRPFYQEGNLLVIPATNSQRLTQIALGVTTTIMYIRALHNDAWSSWKKLLDTDDRSDMMQDVAAMITEAMQDLPSDCADAIAAAYADLTYPCPKGTYCWYNNTLYRSVVDISASESWTAAHWETVALGGAIAETQNSVDDLTHAIETTIQNGYTWSKASIDASNGSPASSSVRLRTGYLSPYFGSVSVNDGYMFAIFVYDENSVYQGRYTGSGYVKKSGFSTEPMMCVGIPSNYQVRYVLSKTDSGSITTADGVNLLLHGFTDSGLTLSGKAADAASVGAMFAKSMVYRGTIATSKDFDEVTEIGTYSFASSSATDTHRPFYQEGNLLVVPATNSQRLTQIAVGVADAIISIRTLNNSTWSDWKKFLNSDDRAALMQYRSAYNSAVDLDTITAIGTYQLSSTSASSETYHRPTQNNAVLIVTGPNTARLAQLYVDIDRNQLYNRSRIDGTWTGWKTYLSEMEDTHDIPENIGVYNVIRRAYQMTTIQFTPLATLPNQSEDMEAGTQYTGVPYSSTRVEQLYVPNAVSIETFMTAMQNPNSYLYTRVSTAPNSKTYYGAVCSTMVAYCYGIDNVIPTTLSFNSYPGFDVLPDNAQNPQGLKLGDMLNDPGNHIVIVTDIIRDKRGSVKEFQVAEAWIPLCRTRRYTPAQMQSKYFDTGYVAHRYAYVDMIPFTPSQWVNVLSSDPVNPQWNHTIMPRRGDYANWRYGEDVEFDINNDGNYTDYVVINLTTEQQAYTGAVASLISLSGVPAGKYEIYLTDGVNNSDPAYFTVQNPQITYTADGNGNVVVSWDAYSFGEAASFIWVTNRPGHAGHNATRAFHILTSEEKTLRSCTVTPPEDASESATDGVWGMRMMFKTEYGLFASDIEHVEVT